MAKKSKSKNIPYTQEELEFIKNSSLKNLKDVAFIIKRSYSSVRRKKWAMDNKDRDVEAKKRYRKDTTKKLQEENGGKAYNYWSNSEIDLIMHSRMTDLELARRLKRTVGAIQSKRYYLEKTKSKAIKSKQGEGNNDSTLRNGDEQSNL